MRYISKLQMTFVKRVFFGLPREMRNEKVENYGSAYDGLV